jgi:hypothetical protein
VTSTGVERPLPSSPLFFPPRSPRALRQAQDMLVEGSVGKPREIGGTIRLVSKLLKVILLLRGLQSILIGSCIHRNIYREGCAAIT